MRKMGGLVKILPFTYTAMLVGSLALMGFPFLTGFYSKDVILEVAYGHFTIEGRFVHILGNIAAFFKALLFLGAGSVIHALSDEQDMRKMGGLIKILPFTYIAILVGSMALMGFPFLTGFYSKDVILELAYGSFVLEGRFVHTLGSLAAFFTAYYSTRLLSLTFLRPVNGNKVFYSHAHESPFPMIFPLFILSFASLFIGYCTRDMMIGMGSDF
jgi:NADH-ubiquinone oxidoreductase chain 5